MFKNTALNAPLLAKLATPTLKGTRLTTMCVLSATGEKLFSEGSPTKKRRGIGEEEGDVRHSGRTQSQDEESYTPCSPPTTLPPECGPSREIRSDTHSSDNRIERLTSPQPEQNHRPFPVRQFNSSRQSTLRAKKNTTISSVSVLPWLCSPFSHSLWTYLFGPRQ